MHATERTNCRPLRHCSCRTQYHSYVRQYVPICGGEGLRLSFPLRRCISVSTETMCRHHIRTKCCTNEIHSVEHITSRHNNRLCIANMFKIMTKINRLQPKDSRVFYAIFLSSSSSSEFAHIVGSPEAKYIHKLRITPMPSYFIRELGFDTIHVLLMSTTAGCFSSYIVACQKINVPFTCTWQAFECSVLSVPSNST